jgi:hypothetical protein
MLKELLKDVPPSAYAVFVLFALMLTVYGVRVGLDVGNDIESARCEALRDVPAYEREQLARQIDCPEQSDATKS